MKTKSTLRRKKEMVSQNLDPNVSFGDMGIPTPEEYVDLERSYGIHAWVYACVRAIATNIASIEILPYVKQQNGSWVEDTKHEFFSLMSRPNAYMTGLNLREYTAAAMVLTGNAYWFCETLGSTDIQEIWPIIPSQVRAVASKDRMIDHYVLNVNGKSILLPYENLIHFRTMNPESFVYGQGALSAAKNTVATDIFAQVWNKSFFANSARPDGVLESEQVLRDDIRTRILTGWKEVHQGSSKRGKVAMLEGGMKFKLLTESVKDMDFVNLRKDLRVEILAAFGVPPSQVGLLEFANYSNMEQQDKMFWNNTLLPLIKNMAQTLTMRAGQISFRPSSLFQADTSKVEALQPNMKMMAETTASFVNSGIPINSVIDALDLPFEHVEGGDKPRAPQSNPFQSNNVADNAPAPAKAIRAPENKAIDRALVRELRWKSFDSRVNEHEGKFSTSMRGFFASQKRRVINRLKEHASAVVRNAPTVREISGGRSKNHDDTMRLVFNLSQEEDAMKNASGRIIRGVYYDFAVSMARQIKPEFDFNLKDPYAEQWIAAKVSRLVRQANEYTLEQISQETADAVQEAVAAGFSEGDTIAQVIDRIDSVYQFAMDTRADRIARTETIGAANAGGFEAMKKTGVQRKEWLSSRDDRVRETHKELDGVQVGIDEPFISPSGAKLQYPGDPEAPADEIIQCRCTPTAASED